MNTNGKRSENTQREEGQQERPKGLHLQQSPSATDGSNDRKERSQSILVHIENSSKERSILLQEAKTLEDLRQGIFREIPAFYSDKFKLVFYQFPKSEPNRVPFQGDLSNLTEIYATVYLYKH